MSIDIHLPPLYPAVVAGLRVSPTGYPHDVHVTESHSSKYDNAVLKLIRSVARCVPGKGDYGTYEPRHIQCESKFDPLRERTTGVNIPSMQFHFVKTISASKFIQQRRIALQSSSRIRFIY